MTHVVGAGRTAGRGHSVAAARGREAELSRRRLVAAVAAAQAAMVAVLDLAEEHDALLRGGAPADGGDVPGVDGGAVAAWLVHRVAVACAGPGDRLALHLRYFAGQRFLDERPDGLLAGVPWPREPGAARDRPP